ncbi:MAG: hypothetical protein CUN54_09360, partial [Phototrophicales bacterium]
MSVLTLPQVPRNLSISQMIRRLTIVNWLLLAKYRQKYRFASAAIAANCAIKPVSNQVVSRSA